MANYQKMYAILCGASSNALDALPDIPETKVAKMILQSALYQAEELYLSEDATSLEL